MKYFRSPGLLSFAYGSALAVSRDFCVGGPTGDL